MSSVNLNLNKLYACLKKEVFGTDWEDLANNPLISNVWEYFLAKRIANLIGFKGKAANKFAETALVSIHSLVTSIANYNFRQASTAELGAKMLKDITGCVKGIWDATALAMEEAGLVGGLKVIGNNIALPIKIISILYDWLSPLIPCLLKPNPTPSKTEAEQASSPLVIDLNGDGVGSYKLKNGVYFDLDNNGFKEKTAWAHYQDGLLALDLNGNGTIDNGAELFGNHTKLKNGTLATNGFEALAQYDDNGDGVINSKDKVWKNLLVWQDKVNDGVSQSDELTKIAKTGITEIQLEYKNSIIGAANDTIFAFQAA